MGRWAVSLCKNQLLGVAWPGCWSIQPWGFLSMFPQDVFVVLESPLVFCNVWALGASWEMSFSSSCPEHHYVHSGACQSFSSVLPLVPRSIIQQVRVLASSVPKLLKVAQSRRKKMRNLLNLKEMVLSFLNTVLDPYLPVLAPTLILLLPPLFFAHLELLHCVSVLPPWEIGWFLIVCSSRLVWSDFRGLSWLGGHGPGALGASPSWISLLYLTTS